jgi:hypothetical protein
MNDRAAVKSPENPGFKPKSASLPNWAPTRVAVVAAPPETGLKRSAFDRNER